MRSIRLLLACAVLGTTALVLATPATAAKKEEPSGPVDPFKGVPDIKRSTISEFDSVFDEAGGIQNKLKEAWTTLKTAEKELKTVLGVAEDQPIKTALQDLQQKAAGKVKVALDGRKPKLKAQDGIPENVQPGIDATNKLVDAGENAAQTALALKDKTVALGQQSAAFPGKIPSMLGSLTGDQVKTAPKIVGDNAKAIKAMPSQIEAIAGVVEQMFTDIKGLFPAE